jgi:hypothetical protein
MQLYFATYELDRVINYIEFKPGKYYFPEKSANRKSKRSREYRLHKRVKLERQKKEWEKYVDKRKVRK